jgi:O-acetyl-ADP-ribose deacetylase (regulator of RNase III)
MRVIEGNLLDLAKSGCFDVIIHGCNCQCVMGKGIALQVKKNFPAAYEADCLTLKGDEAKLGNYSKATIYCNEKSFVIVNAYTQYHWRGKGVKVDYNAIESVMRRIKCEFSGKRIAYPKIGAGLAGGDWTIISNIINTALQGEDHTLVEYK